MNPISSATRVRHVVVAVTALMSVLLYLDRFCISFAEIYIKEDLSLSDTQIGWMLSAFFWTYALAQVPAGWLTDRFGARVMLAAYILLWSLFTGLTGLAFGFVVLLLLRLGFGLAQAGAYPTSASLLSKWVPFSNRGMASSLIAVGGRVGGALAPLLTAYLIVLCVPVSVSSHIRPSDILDLRQLSKEMLPTPDDAKKAPPAESAKIASAIGARILPRLTTASQQAIANPAITDVQLQRQQREQVATDLTILLRDKHLFRAEDIQGLSLPNEAKRLLAADRDSLSEPQVERLNRLLLENVYRGSIKKVYVAGWRWVMLIYGVIGLFVAGLFWLAFRNRPAEHPRCNAAEVELIEHGRPAAAPRPDGAVGGIPIVPLLVSPSMWLNCLSQWSTNVGWVFLVTWLPRYLESVHRVPVEQRAWLVFIPATVGWFGMILGGKLTDRLVALIGLRWGRALPMAISKFIAMGAYLCCLFEPSPYLAVAAFSVVAFSTDLGIGAIWAFQQDVGGRYVGSILGWGNMWGNLGAAMTPPFLIWIVGTNQNWTAAFLTCAAAFLVSGVAALGIDATIPIVPPDADE